MTGKPVLSSEELLRVIRTPPTREELLALFDKNGFCALPAYAQGDGANRIVRFEMIFDREEFIKLLDMKNETVQT